MKSKFYNIMDEAIECIIDARNIFIASHINPDGDNIGSTLALTHALRKLNKNVTPLLVGDIPADYRFLPGIDLYRDYESNEVAVDLFIVLDSGDIDRLGKNKELLDSSDRVLNIDHHISNTNFGHLNLVDSTASATGEIIYELIKKMGIELDVDMATCVYTAISTDTGSFIFDNVTAKTHEIAADLIRTGIDKSNINLQLYGSRSMEATRLFITTLSTLKLFQDNKIAIVSVTQKMLEDSGTTMEDTEGIISFVREIETVEVACILKEYEENNIKVSMRSKRYIDVAQIAANFNGGGHIRAAGCTLENGILEAETIIVDKIKGYFR